MPNNSQLIKNLVFIGKQLGLNKEDVWMISGIGKSTFERYAAEISSPNINTQKAIADAINKAIRQYPVLSARFPDGVSPNDLMTEDLEALSKKLLRRII
jgi:hypothetical protein